MSENVLLSDLVLDELAELTELAEPELELELELRDLRDLREDLAMLAPRERDLRILWPLYLAQKVAGTPLFLSHVFAINASTQGRTQLVVNEFYRTILVRPFTKAIF